MIERDRRTWRGLKGAEQHAARFTDDDVVAIRKDYVAGISPDALATRYRVTIHAIRGITGGKSWRHVFDDPRCPSLSDLRAVARRRAKSRATLTPDDVGAIRIRLASGERGKDIAASYGVGKDCVSSINLGKTWRDV